MINLTRLLKIIQIQRHDFLNHIQVISGLIQLDKPAQVKEYIDQMVAEMKSISPVTVLRLPELKAAILIALQDAQQHQVELNLNINTTLENCLMDGELVGTAVDACFEVIWQYLTLPVFTKQSLTFGVTKHTKVVCVSFALPQLTTEQTIELYDILQAKLSAYQELGKLTLKDQNRIYLCFPMVADIR